MNEKERENAHNYDVGACLLSTLSRALSVASSFALLDSRARLNQGTVIGGSAIWVFVVCYISKHNTHIVQYLGCFRFGG